MRSLRAIAAFLQIGGSVLAMFVYFVGMGITTSAPQEAVVAASALCAAVIPYVFARGLLTEVDATERARAFKERKAREERKQGGDD